MTVRPALRTETACALCDSADYEVVGLRDRRGKPLRTVMCKVCGLVWTNPRPTDASVDQYYASSYRIDYARQRVPTRRKVLRGLLGSEERRREFAATLPPGSPALDVGCGAGEFVYLLRYHGLDATGIEPGAEFAQFSREVMRVPIQTATVQSAVVGRHSQALITMFHMLEHAADPVRTLATIRDWLQPTDGRLVVEVPNVASTVQAPAHRFHYAHLYNFTAETLGALGRRAGLSLVTTRHSGDGGNVTCVFSCRSEGPAPPVALPENVAKLRRMFRNHTSMRHYASMVPYRRAVHRLVRRWHEDRRLARLPTMAAVLDVGAWLDVQCARE